MKVVSWLCFFSISADLHQNSPFAKFTCTLTTDSLKCWESGYFCRNKICYTYNFFSSWSLYIYVTSVRIDVYLYMFILNMNCAVKDIHVHQFYIYLICNIGLEVLIVLQVQSTWITVWTERADNCYWYVVSCVQTKCKSRGDYWSALLFWFCLISCVEF